MEHDLTRIISDLAMQMPFLVVYIIALVMALSRRDKHPRASMYVILASIGLLLRVIVGVAFYVLLPRADLQGEEFVNVSRGATCCFNVVEAALVGLLVAAVFVERRDPNARPARPARGPVDEVTLVDEDEPRRPPGPPSTGIRDRPES